MLSGTRTPARRSTCAADRPAAESAYAALVRLVKQAQAHRAPFVRTADRYAGFFLPATLVSPARHGPSAATRFGRWPWWWLRLPAR